MSKKTAYVTPTESDQAHIPLLAHEICNLVQGYSQANGLTLAGAMSAIGTAAGALLARAYSDPADAIKAANIISPGAVLMIEHYHKSGGAAQ